MLQGRIGGSVRWCVTDRRGGTGLAPYDSLNLALHVGDDPVVVAANRARAAAALGLAADGVAHMSPVHGREVALVAAAPPEPIVGVDALVTTTPGLGLAALAADCVPVILADPAAGVVAVAHAGWKGVRDDVVGAALEVMVSCGSTAAGTTAVLGPAVCGDCYPVPAERAREVGDVAPAAVGVAGDGQPTLDLRAGLLQRLRRAGVTASTVGGCTVENPDSFSHRRDGVTGRFAALVVIDGAPA